MYAAKNGTEARSELFDIATDPNETSNVVESNPDKAAEMKTELKAAAAADRDAVALGDRGV